MILAKGGVQPEICAAVQRNGRVQRNGQSWYAYAEERVVYKAADTAGPEVSAETAVLGRASLGHLLSLRNGINLTAHRVLRLGAASYTYFMLVLRSLRGTIFFHGLLSDLSRRRRPISSSVLAGERWGRERSQSAQTVELFERAGRAIVYGHTSYTG